MVAPANSTYPGTPSFNNQTIVQVLRLSAGGQRLRLRLTNEYGPRALEIGAARVAVVGADGTIVPGSERELTFSGDKAIVLPPGAPVLSDPVALPTKALARLRVSLFLPGDTAGCTCHMSGLDYVQVLPGDATKGALAPAPNGAGAGDYRAFLSGVEVETSAAPGPAGDRGLRGFHHRRLPVHGRRQPPLARPAGRERLVAKYPGQPVAVVNAGISGNRVLSDGGIAIFGQSALTRFDRDVLSIPGATHIVVLEGVNDLGAGRANPPTAEAIIAGYRQLIARGHAHGLKIIGGTILPYGGAAYFTPGGEAERQKMNTWIRTSHEFDGVIDFDAVMRDPAKPERMRADLQSGDWLHPNDAGYKVMGDAVDLTVFR